MVRTSSVLFVETKITETKWLQIGEDLLNERVEEGRKMQNLFRIGSTKCSFQAENTFSSFPTIYRLFEMVISDSNQPEPNWNPVRRAVVDQSDWSVADANLLAVCLMDYACWFGIVLQFSNLVSYSVKRLKWFQFNLITWLWPERTSKLELLTWNF